MAAAWADAKFCTVWLTVRVVIDYCIREIPSLHAKIAAGSNFSTAQPSKISLLGRGVAEMNAPPLIRPIRQLLQGQKVSTTCLRRG